MTIDEAIVHEREVAKEIYVEAMLCHANPDDGKLDDCIESGKYHKQIAEWLEELKMYRECVVIKNMNCRDNIIAYETINRFVVLLKSRLTDAIHKKDVSSMLNLIYEIADQLKDGVKDAGSI